VRTPARPTAPAVLVIVNRGPNANIPRRCSACGPDALAPASIRRPPSENRMERTATIRASLAEVEKTMIAAVVLVILGVRLLRRRRHVIPRWRCRFVTALRLMTWRHTEHLR